jgi:hypothetical protein
MSRLCRARHPILFVREFNSAGAVVDCIACGDTFQISAASLADCYLHFHHTSGQGEHQDMDLFILPEKVEEPQPFV